MTKEAAVSALQDYCRKETKLNYSTAMPKWAGQITDIAANVYLREITKDLIEKVRNSHDDPLDVIFQEYSHASDLLGDVREDNAIAIRFLQYVEWLIGDIYKELRRKSRSERGL